MKIKILAFLVLAITACTKSTPISSIFLDQSRWAFITSAPDLAGGSSVYIDKNNIVRQGREVTAVVQLVSNGHGFPWGGDVAQFQVRFNCASSTAIFQYGELYTGSGTLVGNMTQASLIREGLHEFPTGPGTIMNLVLRRACQI